MSDTMHLPSVEGLPEHIKYRMRNGLAILADAFWYRRNFAQNEDPEAFATRIGELLVCGLGCADLEWLLRVGYIVPVSQERDNQSERKPSMRDALREETLVVLTAAGEAELHRSGFSASGYRFHGAHNGDANDHGRVSSIRYDSKTRELYLRDELVLRLSATARNMEIVVKRFQEDLWRWSIACPFEEMSSSTRAQAVRDAVHSLNELQQPPRIKFHSCEKGTKIWYEVVEEQHATMATKAVAHCVKRTPK